MANNGNGTGAAVRSGPENVTTVYDSHSFKPVDLDAEKLAAIIDRAVQPMANSDTLEPQRLDLANEADRILSGPGAAEAGIGENNALMLALLQRNGLADEDYIKSYIEAGPEERTDMMSQSVCDWLNDRNKSGKDILVANLGVESMLGMQDGALDALDLQSVDVLFGNAEDGHVNTFFYDGLNGGCLAAMDEMLGSMYDEGDLEEDAYFDACDSWSSRMMGMAGLGNEVGEAIAATDAMRQRYEEEYGEDPSAALKSMCEEQGWDYDEFMDRLANPDPKDKDSYRYGMVNGEIPEDIMNGDDAKSRQIKEAYYLTLAENINGGPDMDPEERQAKASETNGLLRTALKAGIDAFRGVLETSPAGQKILAMCNTFVHTPPLNGTLFQEIWDLDETEPDAYTYKKIPDEPIPLGEPDPGSSQPPSEPPSESGAPPSSEEPLSSEEPSSNPPPSDPPPSDPPSSDPPSRVIHRIPYRPSDPPSSDPPSSDPPSSDPPSSDPPSSDPPSSDPPSSDPPSSDPPSSDPPSSDPPSSDPPSSDPPSSDPPSSDPPSSDPPSSDPPSSEIIIDDPSSEIIIDDPPIPTGGGSLGIGDTSNQTDANQGTLVSGSGVEDGTGKTTIDFSGFNPDGGTTPEGGTPGDGLVADGTVQGEGATPENGMPENGTPENGTPENGTPENGAAPENGTPDEGTAFGETTTPDEGASGSDPYEDTGAALADAIVTDTDPVFEPTGDTGGGSEPAPEAGYEEPAPEVTDTGDVDHGGIGLYE